MSIFMVVMVFGLRNQERCRVLTPKLSRGAKTAARSLDAADPKSLDVACVAAIRPPAVRRQIRRRRLAAAVTRPLLRVHLLAPALGAARAVQERQSSVDQLWREADFVVREIRQDRQTILRHVLALPAGILQSAAEQLVELHHVLRP